MNIRCLQAADAPVYVSLRDEMLRDSPWAFAASPEDDAARDVAVVAQRLGEPGYAIAGAIDVDGSLAGVAGVHRPNHAKMSHRGHIWGVYVSPRFRGRGIGQEVMVLALAVARSWPGVTSAGLSVSERSPGARRLYERMGFRVWGQEPGALVVDGRAYDEFHMVAGLSPDTVLECRAKPPA